MIHVYVTSSGPGARVSIVAVDEKSQIGISSLTVEVVAALQNARNHLQNWIKSREGVTTSQYHAILDLVAEKLTLGPAGDLLRSTGALAGRGLGVKMVAIDPDPQSLLWEYLPAHSVLPPGYDLAIARIVPTPSVPAYSPVKLSDGLRILIVTASPSTLQGLKIDQIIARFKTEFSARGVTIVEGDRLTAKNKPLVKIVYGTNRSTLMNELEEFNPHIFNFVGHGDQRGIHLIDPNPRTVATLEASALSACLRLAANLRLVVLSACDTANLTAHTIGQHPALRTSAGPHLMTLAEDLVRRGTPAVVANQFAISDSAISIFGAALYSELLNGTSVDFAVAKARARITATIQTENFPAIEAGVPVLYRQSNAEHLFT